MKKTKNQTTHKKDNKLIYIQILLGVILAVLILLLILNVTGSKTEEKTNLKEKTDTENNIYFLGNKDAPLTITEYSSFTCPFCKRYQIDDKTFENIKTDYIETGKVKYIYKHFTRNNTDIKAANAVECAGEQNKFFEYKKKLYENQATLAKEEFTKYAQEIGLDVSSFEKCLAENKFLTKIENQKQEAIANGITGTPGFIVGNQKISGAQSYQVFKATIDKQL
jgi:protein-disulfide isomerase